MQTDQTAERHPACSKAIPADVARQGQDVLRQGLQRTVLLWRVGTSVAAKVRPEYFEALK
jgi:hypothetical protein